MLLLAALLSFGLFVPQSGPSDIEVSAPLTVRVDEAGAFSFDLEILAVSQNGFLDEVRWELQNNIVPDSGSVKCGCAEHCLVTSREGSSVNVQASLKDAEQQARLTLTVMFCDGRSANVDTTILPLSTVGTNDASWSTVKGRFAR